MIQKQFRQTLIISIAMMVLCFAMLAGTTFAWFVENKESGTNTIYAGNLDVRLWYKTELDESAPDKGWMVLDDTSELFAGSWAPGTVKSLYLKIENCGDVAFNVKLSLDKEEQGSKNLAGNRFALSGYIDCATSFGNNPSVLSQELTNTDRLSKFTDELPNLISDGANTYYKPVLYANEVYYGRIVLTMPSNIEENATNYASDATVPTLKLGLTAVATQIETVNDDFSAVGVDGNEE